MRRPTWMSVVVLAPALAVVGLTACTSSSPRATTTAKGSASSAALPSSASASGSASSPTSASASPLPTSTTTLGGNCDTVLPLDAVDQAVGKTIIGKTAFVVNQPDAKLGQVERINCQYGIAAVKTGSTTTDTKVEVSVSLYSTDTQAARRIADTQDYWRGQGAVPTSVTVSGHAAVILIGYGKPLLVVAAGPRTVAVTMTASLVPAANLNAALIAVAAKALSGAGG